MTDAHLVQASSDPFWARVRQALTGSRPPAGPGEWKPAYRHAAIARSLGMRPRLSEELETQLSEAWSISASMNVSLSLLVLQIDRHTDYFNAYGPDATEDMLAAVYETIAAKLPGPGNVCYRLGRTQFVVVVPNYPVLMARVAAQTIGAAVISSGIAHKASHAGVVTTSVGIAVVNPQGGLDRKFLETAVGALGKAQRRGLNRIETIDLRKTRQRSAA